VWVLEAQNAWRSLFFARLLKKLQIWHWRYETPAWKPFAAKPAGTSLFNLRVAFVPMKRATRVLCVWLKGRVKWRKWNPLAPTKAYTMFWLKGILHERVLNPTHER
jgi:hypothetical protein